jgi:tetratricopeptide (TPR) repeat protein
MSTCRRCGNAVRQFIFTTAGAGDDQLKVWREYPLAVDGWLCTSCGHSSVPRRLSAAEITEFIETGAQHGRASRLDDAEFWFLRAVSSWPTYPLALHNLAQVYIQRADAGDSRREALRREAARLLHRAVAEPDHCPPAAVLALARLEAICGEESEALTRLEALSSTTEITDGVREEATSLARAIRGGKALFTRASELTEGQLVVAGSRLDALTEAARRRLGEAADLLRQGTERDSRSFPAWWLLGKVYQRLGEHEQAHHAFGRALEANPKQVDGCREYVHSCLEVGRVDAALPVAERACSLKPDDLGLRANLALVLLFAGKMVEASEMVEEVLRADPDDAITAALAKVIAAVRDGRRPRPRTLAELEGRR